MTSKEMSRFFVVVFGVMIFVFTAQVIQKNIRPFNIIQILDEKDPLVQKYNQHLSKYDDDMDLYILFETQGSFWEGTELFDLSQKAFQSFLQIPNLEKVNTLFDQEYPLLENKALRLKSFFDKRELSSQGRKHLQETPLYQGNFVDPSGKAMWMSVKLRSPLNLKESQQVLNSVLGTAENLAKDFPGVKSFVLGTEMARFYFMKEVFRSQALIFPLILLVIMSLLYGLFRSWKICALSLFIILLGYSCTVALIVWVDRSINPFSTFALLFVLVISTADLVHLYSALASTPAGDGAPMEIRSRINQAVQKIYKPCFVCAVTTWIGLLSLVVADLPPIVHFGIFCAFGVALCFFLTFHVLPRLLVLFDVQFPVQQKKFDVHRWTKMAKVDKYKEVILIVFFVSLGILGFFSSQLRAGDNLYRKFVDSHPLTQAVDVFQKYFHFTGSIDVTLAAPRENLLLAETEFGLKNLGEEISKLPNVAQIKSFEQYLSLLRQIENKPLGSGKNFENDRELRTWFDFFDQNGVFTGVLPTRWPETRLTVFMKSLESEDLLSTQRDIDQILSKPEYQKLFRGEINGFSTVRAAIFHSIYNGFIKSFLLDFLGIFLCFWIFFRSLRWSLVAMIPNILPVLAIGGLMGALGMTMEYNLIVLVAIVFGIAVDDTTHFLYYLLKSYREKRDILQAVDFALDNTSVALLGTTFIFCVTVPTFFLTEILMFSQVALILILALVLGVCGDLYVLPALLFYLKRKETQKMTHGGIR